MSNLRVILQDFVRWAWVIQALIVFFMYEAHRVVSWFLARDDVSATQATVVGVLFGMLPALGTLFTFAASRIPPPQPRDGHP